MHICNGPRGSLGRAATNTDPVRRPIRKPTLLHWAQETAKSNGFKNSLAPCELTAAPAAAHFLAGPTTSPSPATPPAPLFQCSRVPSPDAPKSPDPLLPPLPTSAIPIRRSHTRAGGIGRRARCPQPPSPPPPRRRLRGLLVRLLAAPASVFLRRGAGAAAMGAGAMSPRRPPRG